MKIQTIKSNFEKNDLQILNSTYMEDKEGMEYDKSE